MSEKTGPSKEADKQNFHSRDFRWKCTNCEMLLGFISHDCKTVRIKYRDLYVAVEGGDVACTCRRCGKVNVLKQNAPTKDFLEKREY